MTAPKVPEKLRPLLEPIGDVFLAKKNARKNHNVEAIAASLAEFGWHHALVATRRGEVLIGNGTLKAALHLGLDRVPVLRVPDSKKTAVRRMVADNRAGELSEWDLSVLGDYEPHLDGMIDTYDMGDLFPGPSKPPPQDPGPQLDIAEDLRKKWDVETGQLWGLMEHRVLCGDAKDNQVVEAFISESADLLLTDPPYGIASVWKGGWGRGWAKAHHQTEQRNAWDKEPPTSEQLGFLVSKAQSAIIWGGNYFQLPASRGWLVWNKPERGFSLAEAELAWTNLDRVVRVFDHRRSDPGRIHPTQKPVALMAWCVEQAAQPLTVLDPFSGSGTTLIACEQLDRRCRAIEIDPGYVAVALQRWADLTGGTPQLLS